MPTTVKVSDLSQSTALAGADSLPFLDVSDTTQSPSGSVDRIIISDFFGATTRVPVGFYQGLGTITVSTPASDSTATWNDGAVTFTHIKANVTDTASAAASKLLDLQVASASMFAVTKAGAVSFASDLAIATNKFNVTASSGNTSVAGTLGVTGIASFSEIAKFGAPSTTTAASAGDTVHAVGMGPRVVSPSGLTTISIGTVTQVATDSILNLGSNSSSANSGVGVRIGARTSFPTAESENSGVCYVNVTAGRLCFHSGATRYYITPDGTF